LLGVSVNVPAKKSFDSNVEPYKTNPYVAPWFNVTVNVPLLLKPPPTFVASLRVYHCVPVGPFTNIRSVSCVSNQPTNPLRAQLNVFDCEVVAVAVNVYETPFSTRIPR